MKITRVGQLGVCNIISLCKDTICNQQNLLCLDPPPARTQLEGTTSNPPQSKLNEPAPKPAPFLTKRPLLKSDWRRQVNARLRCEWSCSVFASVIKVLHCIPFGASECDPRIRTNYTHTDRRGYAGREGKRM